jgi:hypothetical protein
MPAESWQELWRWYVKECVWICSCGCTGPDCCDCCIWYIAMSADERRTRTVIERQQNVERVINP